MQKGARVEVSCSRCGRKVTRTARKTGTVRLTKFVGRVLPPGDQLVIRITQGRTGKGKFRFGAFGKYYRSPVELRRLGQAPGAACNPGSRKPTKCK